MADYNCPKCGHLPKTAHVIEIWDSEDKQLGDRNHDNYRAVLCERCSEDPYDKWERINSDGIVQNFPLYFN